MQVIRNGWWAVSGWAFGQGRDGRRGGPVRGGLGQAAGPVRGAGHLCAVRWVFAGAGVQVGRWAGQQLRRRLRASRPERANPISPVASSGGEAEAGRVGALGAGPSPTSTSSTTGGGAPARGARRRLVEAWASKLPIAGVGPRRPSPARTPAPARRARPLLRRVTTDLAGYPVGAGGTMCESAGLAGGQARAGKGKGPRECRHRGTALDYGIALTAAHRPAPSPGGPLPRTWRHRRCSTPR